MAGISIHWAGLAQVAEVGLVFGVGIVVVFTLGVLGAARVSAARDGSAVARAGAYLQLGLALAGCAAAAAYGLYLLIPQFH